MGKDNYTYKISKNKELEYKMDSIEKYVYNWVFETQEELKKPTYKFIGI